MSSQTVQRHRLSFSEDQQHTWGTGEPNKENVWGKKEYKRGKKQQIKISKTGTQNTDERTTEILLARERNIEKHSARS